MDYKYLEQEWPSLGAVPDGWGDRSDDCVWSTPDGQWEPANKVVILAWIIVAAVVPRRAVEARMSSVTFELPRAAELA